MKICEHCKKLFEDYEETCPDCGSSLKSVEVSDDRSTKTTKILGFSCLGCFGCLGVIFLLHILLFALIFKAVTLDNSEYRYNNLKGKEAKKIVKDHLKTADLALEDVIKKSLRKEMPLRRYNSAEAVISNAFLTHYKFKPYEPGFTNPYLCNETAFIDTEGNIYCITNWASGGDKCETLGEKPCSDDLSMPNVYVDINGAEGPNLYSEEGSEMNDIFAFEIYNTRLDNFGISKKIFYY